MNRIEYPRARVVTASMAVRTVGNSLTACVGASGSGAYWQAVAAGLPPLQGSGITVANSGVGGMSISENAGSGTLIATGAANVDANLVAGKINVLTVFEYTNEMKPNGNNAVNAHAAMRTYCLARKAAAASAGRTLRIIVGTAPPAGADPLVNGATAQGRIDARNAAMKEANRLMREGFREYADVLWDIAALEPFAGMYASGVYTQAAFQATGLWARSDGVADDYTHFGNTGYALIGRSWARALTRVRR